ncbi:MAG TPA: hypothetical protein VMD05_03350 [Candidatus Nanoarchaeia archaeon]|nr:hypothetical protein [Candidatus Nanoarchaeia archaeon]
MNLEVAIFLMKKLDAIPGLPKIGIVDLGCLGFYWKTGDALSLKKSLVSKESLMLIQNFATQNDLLLTEREGLYFLY